MSDDARPLTRAQARAARALLGWSQTDLATHAGVAVATVSQFELGNRMPTRAVSAAMRAALEAAGIEFIARGAASPPGGGVGVRLRRPPMANAPEPEPAEDGNGPAPEPIP